MHISKIVFEGGLEVSNLTKETSTRIAGILFAKPPKVEQQSKRAYKKRSGFRSRHWTPGEDAELRGAYGLTSVANIARQLNRSTPAVYVRIVKLGLARKSQPVKVNVL